MTPAKTAASPAFVDFNQVWLAFVGLVVGAMAMAMYELFSVLERRQTGWAHRSADAH